MSNEPKTKAAIPAPRSTRAKPGFLPMSQGTTAPADNMKAEKEVGMTFTVPRPWHTRFKMLAVQNNMSMKDILFEAVELWERERR